MKIGNVDTDKKVLIVAEIGNNHEGNFEVAQKLLQQAVACGVDAVKFQTFRTEHYVARSDESRFNRLKSFEFTADQFRLLEKLARSLNVLFLSTPFDLVSVDVLAPLVDAFKVSSGDFSFFPLIARVLKTKKPVIFSTGVSDVALIDEVAKFVRNEAADPSKIAFLHCVSSYPVPPEQANLNSISFLKNHVPFTVGYSDHTIGVEAAVASVAAGARIVEKHFTLDKNYSSFRDHQLSADPADMKLMVQRIRLVESMLGNEGKTVQPSEEAGVIAFRRSIVAAKDLSKGSVIQADDLTWVRPAGGLAPGRESLLIGKKLVRDVSAGHRFEAGDVH